MKKNTFYLAQIVVYYDLILTCEHKKETNNYGCLSPSFILTLSS